MAAPALLRPEVATSLALAMVESSQAPLLLLDGDLTVIAASISFSQAFQLDPDNLQGRSIFSLGGGEWDVRQLRSLLTATAAGFAEIETYEMDLNRQGQTPRRLVLYARKLEYAVTDDVRLLLTVSDVTDARVAEALREGLLRDKDSLLREKAILLQEVQHRVANSLQIIASVLLQNARMVQSEETRSHLQDAHKRVMSVADLQRLLAASRLDDIELRAYLTTLCQSLGASLIRDHKQLSLDVTVDDSTTTADISVSLGLIVTELVINALKHAFPGNRPGRIAVDYRAHGPFWTLTVSDNGAGMPVDFESLKPGLGTSIVDALAMQLHARVQVASAHPGTVVSVFHT
jgi:two-component sensor histidine kinase